MSVLTMNPSLLPLAHTSASHCKALDSPPDSSTPKKNCSRSDLSSETRTTTENEPKHTAGAGVAGDINTAKQAVCFIGFPEHLVQLAIDIQRLDHGTDFTSVTELFAAVEEICQNPTLQAGLVMKRHLAEQAEKEKAEKKQADVAEQAEKEKAEKKQADAAALKLEESKLQCASKESTSLSAGMPQAVGSQQVSRDKLKEQERVRKLAKENQKLKQRKMCRACKKVELATSGITFLPCGHFITCEACSEMFDDCPACGKNIMGTVRTFLS